jgi:four helix bundle protein
MSIKSYRDLIVWQKAMDFVVMVYRVTTQFPKDELYGLTQQLRRAAVSVPSNIAEGHGRQSRREYLQFLSIAYGSRNECETQILLGERLKYMSQEQSSDLLSSSAEVGRLLNGLRKSLCEEPTDP